MLKVLQLFSEGFSFKIMTQSIKISNNIFDKIQGKIYTEVNGKQCQVKTKFSLNDVYMEIERFKNKVK